MIHQDVRVNSFYMIAQTHTHTFMQEHAHEKVMENIDVHLTDRARPTDIDRKIYFGWSTGMVPHTMKDPHEDTDRYTPEHKLMERP